MSEVASENARVATQPTSAFAQAADAGPVAGTVFVAPPNSGAALLGRTLPSLLDEALERWPNPCAFNERDAAGTVQSLSSHDFARRAEDLALGLQGLGLGCGERVALFAASDLSFCLSDMACLLAGLVDVPLYLTLPEATLRHILQETECRVLVCGEPGLLPRIARALEGSRVETVVLYRGSAQETLQGQTLPVGVALLECADLEARGRAERSPERCRALREEVSAQDLATILYTSGTTGVPKGVMLSHENISSNVTSAISGLTGFRPGPDGEVALSFLPLTHIFARTLHYGLVWWGVSVHFSDPERLREDLQRVRPTFFAAVPRVLERAYERILAAGEALGGAKRRLFDWALGLARSYDPERPPQGALRLRYRLAERLVYSKWRAALGGEIRTVIVGGAALRPDLVRILGAAGVQVLQGYGLTETSPVIAYNRPERNRPGTVGPLLAGVEVKLAPDGEILTRGPHVMQGYYRLPEATAAVLSEDGWFRTGDLGSLSPDGFLSITGRAKSLFKLSTGKFVMPQPLEERLEAEALFDAVLVLGEGEKFCAALLFVNPEAAAAPLEDETLQARVKSVLREASAALPAWSQVKRAALVIGELSVENGLLTPKLSVRREAVLRAYAPLVAALYGRGGTHPAGPILELEIPRSSRAPD